MSTMISMVATSNGNYNDFWTISGTYIDLKRGSFPQWYTSTETTSTSSPVVNNARNLILLYSIMRYRLMDRMRG